MLYSFTAITCLKNVVPFLNLGFVSPCIIKYSNKSTNQMNQPLTFTVRRSNDHDQRHCFHHVLTVNQRRLLQFISSWWWAVGCPKHVELYLNEEQWIWEIDAFGWLIYSNVVPFIRANWRTTVICSFLYSIHTY